MSFHGKPKTNWQSTSVQANESDLERITRDHRATEDLRLSFIVQKYVAVIILTLFVGSGLKIWRMEWTNKKDGHPNATDSATIPEHVGLLCELQATTHGRSLNTFLKDGPGPSKSESQVTLYEFLGVDITSSPWSIPTSNRKDRTLNNYDLGTCHADSPSTKQSCAPRHDHLLPPEPPWPTTPTEAKLLALWSNTAAWMVKEHLRQLIASTDGSIDTVKQMAINNSDLIENGKLVLNVTYALEDIDYRRVYDHVFMPRLGWIRSGGIWKKHGKMQKNHVWNKIFPFCEL
ncbi:hypothetical protein K445DRAFT_28356 [Daldinia sp. EC12]|nr:hypothetical protein K445DRAFT_28356 [Daldinia sp. EC12]